MSVSDLGLLMSAVIDVLTGDFDAQANDSVRSKAEGSCDYPSPASLPSAPARDSLATPEASPCMTRTDC